MIGFISLEIILIGDQIPAESLIIYVACKRKSTTLGYFAETMKILVYRRLKKKSKAWSFYRKAQKLQTKEQRSVIVSAYALAVSEENASSGVVVTAPTCGSSGVLPAVLRYLWDELGTDEVSILRALATAGLIGNLVKHNASISGAQVGCQGEVGVGCSMAAAAAAQLMGGAARQVEYAASMAIEHNLGLPCDPVAGLVQIPCIERNAAGAVSALNAASLAMISGGRDRVSFDATLEVMHQTGLDMRSRYKETSLGGLAAISDLDRDGVPDVS